MNTPVETKKEETATPAKEVATTPAVATPAVTAPAAVPAKV